MASVVLLRGGGGGVDCEGATANIQHVLAGKTFGGASSEDLQTGTMTNRGAVNATIESPVGGTYQIQQGYHNGNGVVKGKQITTQGAYTITPSTSNQIISAGKFYTGNVTIKAESNFIASNIRSGVKIFGTTGTCPDYASAQINWTT